MDDGDTVEKSGDVEANDPHQFFDLLIMFALNSQFLGEGLSQFFISHRDGLLNLLFNNILIEEFRQRFGNFPLHKL